MGAEVRVVGTVVRDVGPEVWLGVVGRYDGANVRSGKYDAGKVNGAVGPGEVVGRDGTADDFLKRTPVAQSTNTMTPDNATKQAVIRGRLDFEGSEDEDGEEERGGRGEDDEDKLLFIFFSIFVAFFF